MIEQPALLGEASAVADQGAILADDPVAGDQDGEVIGRDQPADLAGVEPGCPGDVIVGTGFAERDLTQSLENGGLRRGEVEPALQMIGKGEGLGRAGEVIVEPGGSDRAGSLGDVQLGNGGAKPYRPLNGYCSSGKFDDERAGFTLHDGQRAYG